MDTASDQTTTSIPELSAALVDQLRRMGAIRTEPVAAALAAVRRDRFAPEATPEMAYSNEAIVTKRDERGLAISSVSAPRVQAFMLEQAQVRPGMRLLEIGSGGVNAAYMSELVGAGGQVTTVDIDQDVTDRARRLLAENGYEQVEVVLGDGEFGVPGRAPYDRIIVTVGSWDIPKAWTDQLTEDGLIVLPLRMRSLNRSIALRRDGDHLVSSSVERAGFVAMQGAGAFGERLVQLQEDVALRVDDGQPADEELLAAALEHPLVETWSAVTVGDQEPFDDLDLFLASTSLGFCLLMAHESAVKAGVVKARPWGSSAVFSGGAFAYVVLRQLAADKHEFGVYGHGPDADRLVGHLAGQIREWDREHRGGPGPLICAYPADTPDDQLPEGLVITKKHTKLTVSWSR